MLKGETRNGHAMVLAKGGSNSISNPSNSNSNSNRAGESKVRRIGRHAIMDLCRATGPLPGNSLQCSGAAVQVSIRCRSILCLCIRTPVPD